VRGFLSETFPDRWIRSGGPIAWPPRSPDITPLVFFLWGYVKDIVYGTKLWDITNLKQRITDAMRVCYSEHGKQSSTVLMCFVQLMVLV
jgi:hypothetical protein